MLLSVALLALPLLVGGCVPMKTPNPGMPATVAPSGCKMFETDVPQCAAGGAPCEAPATNTATSLVCPATSQIMFLMVAGTNVGGKSYVNGVAVCDPATKMWTVTSDNNAPETPAAQFVKVACFPV